MPSYYCTILGDNVISEGEHSQEKLCGGDRTHLRLGKAEEKTMTIQRRETT